VASVSVVVQGRVQGVGFRAHVAQAALRHGLDGQTWNREDGAVEIRLGECDQKVLESFLADVRQGPGIVRELTWEPSAMVVEPGFRVVATPR